ncbi:WD and tetratricopeptide repeats protein 1 isoform X3 [Momordica charantia]|uniref:WD and tetratricopeptide repeats protein 1 isoform X3 n=1 Tax=Momordica charantia TaxID=3673 RepID=A0A6J1BW21_MOMCH|nr:WD and tetratricopeptide repeats protein 1 isoform X3 [Momordica charantia]
MEEFAFHDGNVCGLLDSRHINFRQDSTCNLQMHSSFIQRLSQEKELEGHQGCVNAVAWNSSGSLLISGSDDTRINIWSYSGRKLLHSVDTGHSANIFCTKFVPETSDELVVSGAGDSEVEIGNPNVVWSASEDGTLRQHDFREGMSCPPDGSPHQECHNVLLDLRCGAKRSLADPPRQTLALKSCDISSTRPHLLLVGGSDAFARLYDRRMLPPLSSSQKRMSPPPCVNYFCPMHLSDRVRSSLHLTHVTFSPNGEEILLSYSGEHVYLMNVNHAGQNTMQYTSGDVSKLMSFTPILNGLELQYPISNFSNGLPVNCGVNSSKLDKCRKLLQIAEKCLEGGNYFGGIEACNEILDGHGRNIGVIFKHDSLCTRAALLLKRKWKNDVHMAIRDCYSARKIDHSSVRAHYYMSEALSQLGRHKEALDFAFAAQCLAPSNPEVAEKVESVKRDLAAAELEKSNKGNDGALRSAPLGGVLSLSDFLYRSDANSDVSQDGLRSEREDSDYDEEVELDFETLSGDEAHDVDSNILHGSLNLRIHRRVDPARERVGANGSCGSPSSSQNDGILYQPEPVIDMKQRYVGHCNIGTDIKQASFLGQRGEYVASGSDDGRWFIWEKGTGRLIKILFGDGAVVNCVQCHPYDCAIATSGIDNTIKLWTPTAPVPSIVAGGAVGPQASDVLTAMENNQRRLCRNREAILPFEILERFRMHDFSEGSLHPFECAQS